MTDDKLLDPSHPLMLFSEEVPKKDSDTKYALDSIEPKSKRIEHRYIGTGERPSH